MHFHVLLQEALKDPALNGSRGEFRALVEPGAKKHHLAARNDEEAIDLFLAEYTHSDATFRTYSKECNRLLLWAVLKMKKPISSLTREDYVAYIDFMKAPQASWCGKRARQGSKDWRPFAGPLSEPAIILALSAIDSMLAWWVDSSYITGNPLGLIRQRRKAAMTERDKKVTRFLDDDMWRAFMDEIEAMPSGSDQEKYDKERALFLATMLVMLGPRAFEVTKSRMRDFRNEGYGWFWSTIGKGQVKASVAMPEDMVDGLRRWREFLGLPPYPDETEDIPAIPPRSRLGGARLRADAGISPRRINQILKSILERAANRIEKKHPAKAMRMRKASAHWGRHTSITQKVNAGMDRHLVQLDARHSDLRTTQGYIHEVEMKRSSEASKHRLLRGSKRTKPEEPTELV